MLFKKIKSPILFQGRLNKRNYFEGWYYKQVSADRKSAIGFIPGISLFHRDNHSLLQYIYVSLDKNSNKTIQTGYVRYPIEDFKFTNNPFGLQIGENIFSEYMISVELIDDKVNIQGNLKLGLLTPIERSIIVPNIMGFFAYIPKMECYHGIISMNHNLEGTLKINDEEIDFSGGKGYIEKDWGTSFPRQYIWLQSNNFKNKSASIIASIANIPFMNKFFNGYICNLSLDGKEYRFATYNNSTMKIKNITNTEIMVILENKKATLKIEAIINQEGELLAPRNGKMEKMIKEGLSGEVRIYLYNKQSKVSYEDVGYMAGIEIVGFI